MRFSALLALELFVILYRSFDFLFRSPFFWLEETAVATIHIQKRIAFRFADVKQTFRSRLGRLSNLNLPLELIDVCHRPLVLRHLDNRYDALEFFDCFLRPLFRFVNS